MRVANEALVSPIDRQDVMASPDAQPDCPKMRPRMTARKMLALLLLTLLSTLLILELSVSSAYPRERTGPLRAIHSFLSSVAGALPTGPWHVRPRSGIRKDGTILDVGSFRPSQLKENDRRRAIRNATVRAWDAYARSAWGFDELRPLTRQGQDTFAPGLGTTIVDSLSTLYLMGGLGQRYNRARAWVDRHLDFGKVGNVIVFETVIRVLGGLLSIYHLSGDEMYMRKAEDLGRRLAPAFESETGLPYPRCFLNETGRCGYHNSNSDAVFLAEAGTLQLEFRALAHHSEDPTLRSLRSTTEKVITSLQSAGSSSTRLKDADRVLLPFALSHTTGRFSTNTVTMGAPADSYFEYLIKMWRQGGKHEGYLWELFKQIIDSMHDVVIMKTADGDVITRDVIPRVEGEPMYMDRMDHLSCYIPGMIVLGLDGLKADETERYRRWEKTAKDLTETCYHMYSRSPSGLAGEQIRISRDGGWRMSGGYQLRPEAVEAFFYMYRHTKDEKYRDWGWEVFENIERHCRTPSGGYTVLHVARTRKPRQGDIMHSFLLAETFKYLFLLFGDDDNELSPEQWVFNTEAHPLLITPSIGEERTGGFHGFAVDSNTIAFQRESEKAGPTGGEAVSRDESRVEDSVDKDSLAERVAEPSSNAPSAQLLAPNAGQGRAAAGNFRTASEGAAGLNGAIHDGENPAFRVEDLRSQGDVSQRSSSGGPVPPANSETMCAASDIRRTAVHSASV